MIDVPARFKPHIKWAYPPNNFKIFEEWFYDRYKESDNKSDRIYLPIFPTSFQVNNRYGKDRSSLQDMERYLRQLDKSKKYFLINQFDDGLLFNTHNLDLKVFGSGGGRIDVGLPLVCQPHPYDEEHEKDIFASFIGANNHPARVQVLNLNGDYHCSSDKVSIIEYCKIMSRSVFALCPRGYGANSFRICEALQHGAIPVYISNKFIIPHDTDFTEYGVIIHSGQDIKSTLSKYTYPQIKELQQAGKRAYQDLYTYEGLYKNIMKWLNC